MSNYEDFILINKSTLKKTWDSFKNNWVLSLTGFIYYIINIIARIIIAGIFRGPLFILSGFVSAFVTATLLSNYLYLLYNVIFYNRITKNDFKTGFSILRGKVYSVLVIFWIANYFLSVFGIVSPQGASSIIIIAGILISILLNALPETIYQKHYLGMDNLVYSLEFIKENLLNWFIPNIILGLLLYSVTGEIIGGDIFSTNINLNLSIDPLLIFIDIIGQIIFTFIMIYRGHLFNLLSTSTKRKREFMSKF